MTPASVMYSAPRARGRWSVLIDGRSYAVRRCWGGEVSVNGRVFQVEVFDPRESRGRRSRGERLGTADDRGSDAGTRDPGTGGAGPGGGGRDRG